MALYLLVEFRDQFAAHLEKKEKVINLLITCLSFPPLEKQYYQVYNILSSLLEHGIHFESTMTIIDQVVDYYTFLFLPLQMQSTII